MQRDIETDFTTLIKRLRERANDPKLALDINKSHHDGCGPTAYPSLSLQQIETAEQILGFKLPPLLREIYMQVGDGGFGPGYGLFKLLEPDPKLSPEKVVNSYQYWSKTWPSRLLIIFHWGCEVYSCVDCNTPEMQVIRYDPNAVGLEEEYLELGIEFVPGEMQEFRLEAASLQEWLESWLAGENLWEKSYLAPKFEKD